MPTLDDHDAMFAAPGVRIGSMARRERLMRGLVGLTALAVILGVVYSWVNARATRTLAKQMQNSDHVVRLTAARDIATTVGDGVDLNLAVDALLRGLNDPETEVRKQSRLSLMSVLWMAINADPNDRFPDVEAQAAVRKARPSIEEGLDDPESGIRILSAQGMSHLASIDPKDIPAGLNKAVDDDHPQVRAEAFAALAKFKAPRDRFIPAMLKRIGNKGPESGYIRRLAWSMTPGPETIPMLVKEVEDGSPSRMGLSADLLRNVGTAGKPYLDRLIARFVEDMPKTAILLSHKSDYPRNRDEAAEDLACAIAKIARACGEESRVVPILIPGLEVGTNSRRAGTASALSLLGPGGRDAVGPLAKELDRLAERVLLPHGGSEPSPIPELSVVAMALGRVSAGTDRRKEAILALVDAREKLAKSKEARREILHGIAEIAPTADDLPPAHKDLAGITLSAKPVDPSELKGRVMGTD